MLYNCETSSLKHENSIVSVQPGHMLSVVLLRHTIQGKHFKWTKRLGVTREVQLVGAQRERPIKNKDVVINDLVHITLQKLSVKFWRRLPVFFWICILIHFFKTTFALPSIPICKGRVFFSTDYNKIVPGEIKLFIFDSNRALQFAFCV